MDPGVQKAIDSLFDNKHFTWDLSRPNPGAEPGVQEIFLGVGTREAGLPAHPRMLQWKLPQWRSMALRSTTEVVLKSAAALDELHGPVSVRAHEPTLDTVTAALLIAYRVMHHQWPEGIDDLVHYVSEWEQGRTEHAGAYETGLGSVFYGCMRTWEPDTGGISREMVKVIGQAMAAKLDLEGLKALPPDTIPSRISRRLKADADLYKAELSRAQKVQLDLPLDALPGAPYRRIDALFLSSPQDVTVLKLLARPDTEESSYHRGFELMAVHAPNATHAYGRHTLSLAPESPGTLADLAMVIDRVEGDRLPDGTPRPTGKPRFTWQPAELGGLSDPWYSDGYAWAKGRSTLVAPPFAGSRLTREQIWEAIWDRFHVGKNVQVSSARTIFVKPYRFTNRREPEDWIAGGWKPTSFSAAQKALLPSVGASFLGGDVVHLERPAGDRTLHVSLYPSDLVLVWVEQASGPCTMHALSTQQSQLALGDTLDALPEITGLKMWIEPLGLERWLTYGAYRVNRAHSTMIDDSRSVLGLFHAVAAGVPPTLQHLPSPAAIEAREVRKVGESEHWLTPTGGARLQLELEETTSAPLLNEDFALFLLTTGQRYSAFEITRKMGELERQSRVSRWASLRPAGSVRGDVMLFTNSLWYARVSDDPELNARYAAWRGIHHMEETVEALRDQTTELDEYRKERFESMVGVLVFVFLPITIVCGFFSGAQFNEMDTHVGLPWTTGGWKVFLAYTGFFTVVVFGALVAGRLLSWRKR